MHLHCSDEFSTKEQCEVVGKVNFDNSMRLEKLMFLTRNIGRMGLMRNCR